MLKVWKSVIVPNSKQDTVFKIDVPAKVGSEPLSVGLQNGKCCVWFSVDPEAKDSIMTLYCVGTGFGAYASNGMKFIGTIIEGSFVWHIFWKPL